MIRTTIGRLQKRMGEREREWASQKKKIIQLWSAIVIFSPKCATECWSITSRWSNWISFFVHFFSLRATDTHTYTHARTHTYQIENSKMGEREQHQQQWQHFEVRENVSWTHFFPPLCALARSFVFLSISPDVYACVCVGGFQSAALSLSLYQYYGRMHDSSPTDRQRYCEWKSKWEKNKNRV